jgi:hypothetical protein
MTRITPPPISSFQASLLDDLEAKLEVFVQQKVTAQQKEHISWEGLLERNICVGEVHHELASKRFLIENIKLFKESGFYVIFMEHLSQREDSSLLKIYELNEDMPQELKERLARLDRQFQSKLYPKEWGQYNFTKIVEAAKQNGIKVIPLEESEHSYQFSNDGSRRAAILSLNAKNAIDQFNESGQEGKWLALVGSAHLNRCYNVPGICDIVNAQDLLITDANENNKVFLPPLRVCQSPTETTVASYKDVDGSKRLLNVSMSLIIDPRSDMSYESISGNESLRATAENLSSSSSSSAAAAEDREVKKPRQEEGQKENKESEEDRSRLEKEVKGPSGYFPIPTEAQRVIDEAKGNSSPGKGL